MKRFRVKIEIDDGDFRKDALVVYVYIEAKKVVQVSHSLLKADGVPIDLPGNIINVKDMTVKPK